MLITVVSNGEVVLCGTPRDCKVGEKRHEAQKCFFIIFFIHQESLSWQLRAQHYKCIINDAFCFCDIDLSQSFSLCITSCVLHVGLGPGMRLYINLDPLPRHELVLGR